MRKRDFQSVLDNMRLANGQVWTLPIVLDISKEKKSSLKNGEDVILVNEDEKEIARLKNIEIYPYDKKEYAQKVFRTLDEGHPGVKDVMGKGDYLVGGEIEITNYELYIKFFIFIII